MKIQVAKQFVKSMQDAIDKAETEGRDELSTADLSAFSAADDAAREDFAAAISAAIG